MKSNDNHFDMNRAYGYSSEDVQMVIETMASEGKEPTFCMGDDIPLAVLSQKSHMLYDYFKQRFAQVSFSSISFDSSYYFVASFKMKLTSLCIIISRLQILQLIHLEKD